MTKTGIERFLALGEYQVGSKYLTDEQRRERVEAVEKLASSKNITTQQACAELRLSTSQYYQALNKLKDVKKKKQPKQTSPKNQMVQVVVDKREDVNIVIMKGNAETVKEIASSLSGIFGGE